VEFVADFKLENIDTAFLDCAFPGGNSYNVCGSVGCVVFWLQIEWIWLR